MKYDRCFWERFILSTIAYLMAAGLFFVLYSCGGDEKEVLQIVNITCDGKWIEVEFNKPPGYLEISFQYEGWNAQFLPAQEVTGIKWQGNSVSFPYPFTPNNTVIRHFSIESESYTETFLNPCN